MEAVQLEPRRELEERTDDDRDDPETGRTAGDGRSETAEEQPSSDGARISSPNGERHASSNDGRSDGSESTRTSADDASEQLDSLSMDELFEVLSNPRRRSTIAYLHRNGDGPVALRDLAEQIAAWENGVPANEVTYKERKRVYTSLYQSHLDKMDRLGLLRYDRNRGMIEPTAATDQLAAYLDSVTDDEDARRYVPIGVAAVCVAFVIGAWTGVLPLAPQSGFVVASVVASVFLAVSGVWALVDN